MVQWSGPKKFFTILAFIAPTIIGVTLVSLYPMIYNLYISLTNRNRFHPVPDCANGLTGLIDPTCWSFTARSSRTAAGQPFTLQDPLLGNYGDILGKLFSGDSLLALGRIVLALLPLLIAYYLISRVYSKRMEAPSSGLVYLIGLAGTVVLWFVLNAAGAIDFLMSTGDFFVVMARTILYVILCIPLFFIVGLIIALVLNDPNLRAKGFWRVLLIVPWAVPSYITALIWQFFFRGQGTINQILTIFGIQGPTYLNDPTWAFVAVVVINLWLSYPFFMVVILGALQAIPADQYEAAEVDGATWWDKLVRITLPLLRPAVMPAVVLSSITTFQMFNTVYLVTQGGPIRGAGVPGATEFVMVYAYKQVFQTGAYGSIGAFAMIIFVLLFAATLFSLRLTRITQGAYE